MTLLKNCRVIPELTEGYDGQFADILIDGKFIAGICAPGTADAAADDECIDMEGKTVLPGLFDLHMHLNFDSMSVADIAMRAPEQAIRFPTFSRMSATASCSTPLRWRGLTTEL